MADLGTIANETVTKLTTLFEHTDQVQATLEESQAQLTDLSGQVDESWAALEERAQALLEKINSVKEDLATEAQQSTEAINQLQDKMQSTKDELEQELEATKEAIAELGTQVESVIPAIEEAFQTAEESFTSLKESITELESGLDEVFSETHDYLADEMTGELGTHQTEIDEKVAALEAAIAEEYLPQLTEKSEAFSQHIADMIDQLSTQLQEIGEETEQSTQSTLDQIRQSQQDGVGELLDSVNEISQLMERLGGLIDNTTDAAIDVKDGLMTAVNTTNIGLNAAVGIFEDVVELLHL
jgi:DNA repair exonuclease SbcCD ATPase subunit